MKNLDLVTLGVEEMDEVQMQKVDGGLRIKLIFATVDTSKKDKWEWFWEAL